MDRVIVVNGASKTYAMTGWRLGWSLGPMAIIQAMTKFQSQSVSCASPFTQLATLQAVTGAGAELKEALGVLRKRRDFVHQKLNELGGLSCLLPDGAFYMWVDIRPSLKKRLKGTGIVDSKSFSEALLEQENVAVVPGVEFGQEGYLRLSYALDGARMDEAIDRLKNFLEKI